MKPVKLGQMMNIDSRTDCGHILTELDLSIREWRCPSCQSVNGRDENAEENYLCGWGIDR